MMEWLPLLAIAFLWPIAAVIWLAELALIGIPIINLLPI